MLFKFKGIDSTGKKIRQTIDAKDIKDAKLKLKKRGILYSCLKEEKSLFLDILKNFVKREMPSKKLFILSRNLSIYLNSGIPSIVYAIKFEKSKYQDDKAMTSFLSEIEEYLKEGKSFYQSLEMQNIYKIPDFFKYSVKIAEDYGIISTVLMELSKLIKHKESIGKRVFSALAYPVFVLIFSFFVVGFMLSVVIPKITGMFEQLGQKLPTITVYVVTIGNFIHNFWPYIILFVFAAYFTLLLLYKNCYRFSFWADRLVLHLPLFGKMVQTFELANFSYMVSTLLKAGVVYTYAIKLATNSIKNRVLQKVFYDASEDISRGKKLSNALLKNTHIIDSSFLQAVMLAEETSQMQDVLFSLSLLYNEENKDKTDLLLSLLEPVLILFVGLIIGIIVLSMLLPVFSLNLNDI